MSFIVIVRQKRHTEILIIIKWVALNSAIVSHIIHIYTYGSFVNNIIL